MCQHNTEILHARPLRRCKPACPRWAIRWSGLMRSSTGRYSAPFLGASTRSRAKARRGASLPVDWGKTPAKLAHKDTDARWTKKGGQTTRATRTLVRNRHLILNVYGLRRTGSCQTPRTEVQSRSLQCRVKQNKLPWLLLPQAGYDLLL